jgi:mannose-6-phosphate isomerase-like protein (cupin superfamily)
MIRPAIVDIIEEARRNSYYRRVVTTGAMSQLVVMAIPPFGEVGEETHRTVEQTIVVVEGAGTVSLNGFRRTVRVGDAIVIPPGTAHNLKAGRETLRLFTIYTPPNHIDGVTHRTRADADSDERDQAFGRRVERGPSHG